MNMQLLEMGTLPRHNHLASSFFLSIGELFKRKEVYPLQENCMLCFAGRSYSGEESLICVEEIDNIDFFRYEVIARLDFVQPDFLLFHKNRYIQNASTSKTAGVPDLVVEIWSDSNSDEEKKFKQRLYSSSSKCEHWYLTQDSNTVERYKGINALPSQDLSHILRTTGGLEFDLTHLAQF